MTRRRKLVAAGAVATSVLATAVVVTMLAGGGKAVHHNTSLDASSRTSLLGDWKRGYTRTGTIAYTQSATTVQLFAANVVPYTVDATDTGWPIEPAQTNRFPTNVSGACSGVPWVCSTATMDSTSADPAGGTTASSITMGGGSLDATAFGYNNSTAVDLRMWVNCSSGTLDASHVNAAGGIGHWQVNCTTVGGSWALLTPTHAAVTENEAWTSNGSGYVRMRLSGADATIWHTTATEALGYVRSTRWLGTVPTTDATGSTVGAAAWTVDNSTGAYWTASGVTKVETKTTHNGTCWGYSGNTITLSGCHGIWYALSLTWSY